MKDIKNVLLCGLGAIGSIYADKIQEVFPNDLKILVDEKRLLKYTANPIVFNGKKLNLNYILPDETEFKADLIIISTKYDGLKEVIKNIKNFVTDDTIIISLLNGITSEKDIAEEYGWDKLLYSYFIGHSSVRDGNLITHDGINTIVFGSKTQDDKVDRVKSFFDKTNINYKIPKDIIRSLWLKYMLNVSANQVSAVLKFTFGDLIFNENAMKLLKNVMQEVQVIAKAEGVNNTETMTDEAVEQIKTMSPDGKTSMLQDVLAGRKTEVDMFAGTIIQLGEKHNISTQYNKILKEMIDAVFEKSSL